MPTTTTTWPVSPPCLEPLAVAQPQELVLTLRFDCRLSAPYKHHVEGHPWLLCPGGQGLDVRGSPGFRSEAAGLLPKTEQAGTFLASHVQWARLDLSTLAGPQDRPEQSREPGCPWRPFSCYPGHLGGILAPGTLPQAHPPRGCLGPVNAFPISETLTPSLLASVTRQDWWHLLPRER